MTRFAAFRGPRSPRLPPRRIVAARRRNAPQQSPADHAFGELVGAGEYVGSAAGEAHQAEAIQAEPVRDLLHVFRPSQQRLVQVRRRFAQAGALDGDQAHLALLRGLSRQRRDPAATSRRAGKPEDRGAVGVPCSANPIERPSRNRTVPSRRGSSIFFMARLSGRFSKAASARRPSNGTKMRGLLVTARRIQADFPRGQQPEQPACRQGSVSGCDADQERSGELIRWRRLPSHGLRQSVVVQPGAGWLTTPPPSGTRAAPPRL